MALSDYNSTLKKKKKKDDKVTLTLIDNDPGSLY